MKRLAVFCALAIAVTPLTSISATAAERPTSVASSLGVRHPVHDRWPPKKRGVLANL